MTKGERVNLSTEQREHDSGLPEAVGRRRLTSASIGVAAASFAFGGAWRPAKAQAVGKETELLHVKDYGAKGDGVTDDTRAVNAAIDAVRARHARVAEFPSTVILSFSPGYYRIEGTVNLTNLRQINTLIDGQGAVLVGFGAGIPVVDALGSRWLTVRDLNIVGDPVAAPSIGLLIGRIHKENADDHLFDNLKITGNFAFACLYNHASETSCFLHLILWNNQDDAHCLVQDGLAHFGVCSEFAGLIQKQDHDISFNENLFLNCVFRSASNSLPIWLGDTSRHTFIGCYAATNGHAAICIFSGWRGNVMLSLDVHCETDALRTLLLFDGSGENTKMFGLKFSENFCFSQQTLMALSPRLPSMQLTNIELVVAKYGSQSCRLVGSPEQWKLTGSYSSTTATAWNCDECFSGYVMLGGAMHLVGVKLR